MHLIIHQMLKRNECACQIYSTCIKLCQYSSYTLHIYNYIHHIDINVHVHVKYTPYTVHTGVYSFHSFFRRLEVDKSPHE